MIDSSRLYQLLLLNDKVKGNGYVTDDGTVFGNANNFNVYNVTKNATNMYALNTVNFLGQGFSMMSQTNAITGLASISKVLPFVRQDTFLGGQDDKLRKFIFQHLNTAVTALFGTKTDNDVFGQLADSSLLGENYTKVLDPTIGKSLFEVLQEFDALPNKIANAGLFAPISMDKLASLSGGINVYAKFVELYDTFNLAIKASPNVDQQKLNEVLSTAAYKNLMAKIDQLRNAQVQGSLWDILIMMVNAFKYNQILVLTFLGAFADFGAMFGSSANDGTEQSAEQKANVAALKAIAGFSDEVNYNLHDFTDPKNGTVKAVDDGTGKMISYHDWVLMKLGMTKDATGAYQVAPGSMMSYMAKWNTSGGMYEFLKAMFKSSDSLFTKWTNQATSDLTNNYFDYLYRDDIWDIDPNLVQRVDTGGGWSTLTYTMTYNGLGDSMVNNQQNLDKYHSTSLNIQLTSDNSGNLKGVAPTGDANNPNYSLEDWKNHDGLGTTFNPVKNTYTVSFDITPEGAVAKMGNFIWTINNKGYY
ncbi:hypothetical protein [Spiroplasma sp. DGKH1]|uniref:hypothetical protein n=1 Tax=Spiroplasma sp. DGKH1 TaxID=3050074 RepID=UPI0034C66C22